MAATNFVQNVSDKIRKWTKDVEQFAEVAKDEPQLAYSAYTKALSMRWCFLQRTVPDTKTFFAPLEEVIRNKLIPAIIGRNITDIERKLISLPVRLGGMGIQNPCDTADTEFRNSTQVTQNLTKLIMDQETDLSNYDELEVTSLLKRIRTEKEENFILQLENLNTVLSDKVRRCVELAGEKGAGAWLSALPLQSLGYVLNKQEFRDSIYLRYGWMIPNTPAYCGCKSKNDINHTLNCKLGGYVTMRHNNIRDLEASLLREVCKDVKVKPVPIRQIKHVWMSRQLGSGAAWSGCSWMCG